jgi:thiamine-phosphate pyrophosphorylase
MKEQFGLYLILTDPIAGYEACANAAVDCGVCYLQLRMKDTSQETLLKTAHSIRSITLNTPTRFIVNDNLVVAIESDADGIHLGQNDMPLTEARNKWNTPGKIFGLSTHSMEQANLAQKVSPDYIGIGPVFPSPTKPDADPAIGPVETGRIIQSTPLTTVAIGGINANNLPRLLEAGMDNFCTVRAVNQTSDPKAAIQNIQKIWKSHCF